MSLRIAILPASASTFAPRSDALFYGVLLITGIITIIIAVVIIIFAIRYRSGSRVNREYSQRKRIDIEITWIVAPFLILMAIFLWSSRVFSSLYETPQHSLPVYVLAKQWMWKIEHDNGIREIDQLHVPLGIPVQLIMTSQDVIHSFYVPAFRIKQDVLPGRYTSLWFTATRVGQFELFCAEFCGTDHSHMGGTIVVMPVADYQQWLERSNQSLTLAQRGFELFRKNGCDQCHAAASTVQAPDLENLYGSVVQLESGENVIADDTYLRDSILLPNKQVVAGFRAIMPSFKDQVNEEDIVALIAYMKEPTPP